MFKSVETCVVADRRSTKTEYIGAWISDHLNDAVQRWINKHPGESRTRFLLWACVEKLKSDGIDLDVAEAVRDGRARLPIDVAFAQAELNEPASSVRAVVGMEVQKTVYHVKRQRRRGRSRP